jgi:hypothetical protein
MPSYRISMFYQSVAVVWLLHNSSLAKVWLTSRWWIRFSLDCWSLSNCRKKSNALSFVKSKIEGNMIRSHRKRDACSFPSALMGNYLERDSHSIDKPGFGTGAQTLSSSADQDSGHSATDRKEVWWNSFCFKWG